MNANDRSRPQVVVLGAGFGGLTFCQAFAHPHAQVTVVDRQNHHLFQPLLYQVATAGLSAPEIAQPTRSILRNKPNLTVLLQSVTGFDLAHRQELLAGGTLNYDYPVLALGSVTSYFGHPEWNSHAPGLKSLDDALRVRRQFLLAFERAENSLIETEKARLMSIVVIGGGPTGVELPVAFAELTRQVLKRDFRRIDPRQARVILVEGDPRLLPKFSACLSAKAQQQLERLSVEVRTNTKVESIGDGRLVFANDQRIDSANIIGAAGISAHPVTRKLGVELDRSGRVQVNPDLSLPGHAEVFAIGDLAAVTDQNGNLVPGVSAAAMQMARLVARILKVELNADGSGPEPRPAFRYWNRGTMATVGRSADIAQIVRFEFSGWLAWLLVHLIFLIGIRNKAAVLLQWIHSYFTYKSGSRIITGLDNSATGSRARQNALLS